MAGNKGKRKATERCRVRKEKAEKKLLKSTQVPRVPVFSREDLSKKAWMDLDRDGPTYNPSRKNGDLVDGKADLIFIYPFGASGLVYLVMECQDPQEKIRHRDWRPLLKKANRQIRSTITDLLDGDERIKVGIAHFYLTSKLTAGDWVSITAEIEERLDSFSNIDCVIVFSCGSGIHAVLHPRVFANSKQNILVRFLKSLHPGTSIIYKFLGYGRSITIGEK